MTDVLFVISFLVCQHFTCFALMLHKDNHIEKKSEKIYAPKAHTMHCQEPWFSFIQKGVKPVEGRKATPKHLAIQPGDIIEFFCDDRHFLAEVERIERFGSLDDYFHTVGLAKALPGILSLEEGKKIYLQWSTEQEIATFGFLGIFVKPLST